MSLTQRIAITAMVCSSPIANATGLNFWESSTSNSALASANGASAVDASILATAPSSMTQLKTTTVTASVTRYQVDTDYDILGTQSSYSKANPIPAGFMVMPIDSNWSVGLAAYSRTAADISISEFRLPPPLNIRILEQARVRPIVVSFAPSVAYKMGDVSIGLTLEYQYADYLLEVDKCKFLGGCNTETTTGNTDGWTGAISATWQASSWLTLAATHRLDSQFGDSNIQFALPSITSVYGTIALTDSWSWHNTFSLSRWDSQGVTYTDYDDPIQLLKGSRHSKRYATSMEYRIGQLALRGGVSMDEAIDSFGGEDVRYRLGAAYTVNEHLTLDLSGFSENYARKNVKLNESYQVDVQNKGYGVSFGLTYRY
ncbi:outer membrane protein transport protein [Vibrio sp. SCSIO 43140]|uniref:OmpP1/FadL family transporter n=1 Tax=Vibrio sp. SCSIO 43140 TaxID=2819100 RepID=UPI0020758DD4|nr:outer membrane protein transport protein [Vibrio sp. SCSIO 43140]USD63230.1 outer membrane protein transport protein [Vibrio sp. SCSIO 43140]